MDPRPEADPGPELAARGESGRSDAPRPGSPPAAKRFDPRKLGGPAVAFGILAAKFKAVLLALLNFKYVLFAAKYGLTALSFVASIWFYTLFFGLKFAIVFVLLFAIHEAGHVIFVRALGFSAPAIFFVPGLGAFTTWRDAPKSIFQESAIAFGGPLLGALGSVACYVYGLVTGEPFWLACAYTGFVINLFNMIPLPVFDGGRMTAALSPFFWLLGFALVVAAAVVFHWWSPLLLAIAVLSIPRAVAAYRGKIDPRYFSISGPRRALLAAGYFGLLAVLLAGAVVAHVNVPAHAAVVS